jgi:hypothetical protein
MMTFVISRCERVTSNVFVPSCVPLVAYSPDEQNQAADEMEAMPDLMLTRMGYDYGRLRAQVRAACNNT